MPDKFVLGQEAIRQLKKDHEKLRYQLRRMDKAEAEGKVHNPSGGGSGERRDFLVGLVTTIVSAGTGNVFGTGKVQMNKMTLNQMTGVVTSDDEEWAPVDVYNIGPAIPVGAYVRMNRDFRTGSWIVRQADTEESLIGKVTSEITAAAGDNVGAGQVTIRGKAAGAVVTVDTGVSTFAYNVTAEAIPVGDLVRLTRDAISGDYLIDSHVSPTGSASANINCVKAQGYWTYAGVAFPSTTSAIVASVSVKKCDLDGTEAGAAFTCYLPCTNTGSDPNVVPDQIFTAEEIADPSDDATNWVATSGYEDSSIGTVRMFAQNLPSGPSSGWAKMDGTDNAEIGSGFDMTGAVPKHHDTTAGTSNSGTANPSTTSGSTQANGATATGTTGGTALTTDTSGTLTTESASGTTGATTPATVTSSTVANHSHTFGSHNHSFSATSSSDAHTHSTPSHSHSIGSHSHSFSATASGTTGNSAVLTTSEEDGSGSGGGGESDFVDTCHDDCAFEVLIPGAGGGGGGGEHTHTVPAHAHTFSDGFSGTTGSSSGTTGTSSGTTGSDSHSHTVSGTSGAATGSSGAAGSHSHTVAGSSHTHSIGAHVHELLPFTLTIPAHTHSIPSLAVVNDAHTHTTQKQLTKTLCFFERVDNSDFE